jgi:Domain of unknown function (DUF4288)
LENSNGGWYSARLLYESDVDDHRDIAPLCEESIIVLRAGGEEEAKAEAARLGAARQHRYTNPDGDRVSWRFVRVVELQDLCESELLHGTEVYSHLFREGDPYPR